MCGPLTAGCALLPGQTQVPLDRQIASRHHYYHVPKQPDLEGSHVAGVPKLNPQWWVENSDDPLPWWWRPEKPLESRKRSWFLRNPMHNFTSYVIGVSDRHNHRYGINAHSVWNDKGPVNLAVTRAGPLIYLPMVSCRGRFLEGYLGWRHTGSFGAALRLAQHDSDGTGPRGRSPKDRAREFLARQQAETQSGERAGTGTGPGAGTGTGAGPPDLAGNTARLPAAQDALPAAQPHGAQGEPFRSPYPPQLQWRDPATSGRSDLFRLPRL